MGGVPGSPMLKMIGIIPWLVIAALSAPIEADEGGVKGPESDTTQSVEQENRIRSLHELMDHGNSEYRTGIIIGCLAVIPPLFGTPLLIAVPTMGNGADAVETAARGLNPNFEPEKNNGWNLYHQSWIFLGVGATAIMYDALCCSGLAHSDNVELGRIIRGVGLVSLGVGVVEQGSAYRFSKRRREARRNIPNFASISMQPDIYLGKKVTGGAELQLVLGFK